MNVMRTVLPGLLAATLAGCAAGPDYRQPEVDTGAGWAGPVPAAEGEVDLANWWRGFGDPELQRLVETALAGNLDLRQAQARVAEARALRATAAGGRYPSVGAAASVTRRRQSENGPLPIGQIPGIDRDQTIYEPGFDALWELDLFGRTRRAVEAADARLQLAEENRHATRITVAAETARSYLSLRGAQHELEASLASVSAVREVARLVRLRVEAGEEPEAAVAAVEAELAALEARLPALQAKVTTAALSIGVLLGELPEAEAALAEWPADYVTLAPIPVGERADLLRRRPDVRAAERSLAAATADLGVATADLFPRIAFGANAGFQSLETGNLFESGSQAASAALSISWRMFEGGRIRAQIHAGEARVETAALAYEKSVLEALADAERALAGYRLGLQALDRQALAVDAARRSYAFAGERYRAGDISLLQLFDAERGLREAENAYALTHTQAATGLVALFKALGGGWEAGA